MGRKPNDEDIQVAITTLEHSDRLCFIELHATGLQLAKVVTVMPKPLPLLMCLRIRLLMEADAPVLPSRFLGRSAPCLRELYLDGIPFPTLPTLLLSTSYLTILTLTMIPPTGYFSPEAVVASLAVLPSLEGLTIEFQSSAPCPDHIRPPPATRTVLPALTSFNFQGAYEYLEDLVAQIDGPQLNNMWIVYMDEPYEFSVTQLSEFIDSSVGPELNPSKRARVSFHVFHVTFTLYLVNFVIT